MSFVAAGTFVIGAEAAVALGAVGTGLIGGALVGAGTGALVNGLSGRSVLNGALIGGAIGGAGGALGGYFAGAELAGGIGEMAAADAGSQIAAGVPAAQVSTTLQTSYGLTAAQANAITASAASSGVGTTASTAVTAANAANAANNAANQTPVSAGNNAYVPPVSNPQTLPTAYDPMQASQEGYPLPPATAPYDPMQASQEGYPLPPSSKPSQISTYANKALDWVGKNKALTAAGLGAAYLASKPNAFKPNYLPAYNPPTAQSYGLGATLGPNYRPTFAAAQGGIAKLADGGTTQAPLVPPAYGGITAAGITGLQASPAKQQQSTPVTTDYIKSLANQYGVNVSDADLMPSNAVPKYAYGGDIKSSLGGYSDGGRLLKGPGDGMSDNIPASIANKQPARLADGEFVVPADVVSHLGNGSTDAGAKHLYKMMDNVRKARTGRKSQGKQIKANKYLPA
jgi:hypothetical protein